MVSEHLFIYGTLGEGHTNTAARLLQQHGRIVGRGVMRGQLYNLGEYPGAVDSDLETDVISGVVYQLDAADRLFPVLDEYEGCHAEPAKALFVRVRREVRLETGEMIRDAWVYLYNQRLDRAKRIN